MDNTTIITERECPIQPIWILETTIPSMVGLIFPFLYALIFVLPFISLRGKVAFDLELPIYVVLFCLLWVIPIPIHFLYNAVRRSNFHFALEEKFLSASQGVFSKQTRHIPYGVIQNVIVSQNIFDRFFGLYAVVIENASQTTGNRDIISQMQYKQNLQSEDIGFKKNFIEIPGLAHDNAQTIRTTILQRVKENPIEDLGL